MAKSVNCYDVAESQRAMKEFPRVKVAQGILKGREAKSKNGKPYLSFQAIPYAQPPLGPLRFKVAKPMKPWQGEWDALTPGPVCKQCDPMTKKLFGSEDCLYLNVYTPQLPSPCSSPRAVMVWIHGGGFTNGSGNPDSYGPDFLVDAGVVLVTINYRVNVLGFLSLEDEEAPGNVGLKDQVAALRWVQQNIANFGGDPNNVTIFGESAGGASVHYQLLSPMSKGLFHKAIAQSGSVLNPWAFNTSPRKVAFNLGKILGYHGDSSLELVEFLRKVDADALVKATIGALEEKDKLRCFTFAFTPTLEVAVEGVERFLPGHPIDLLEQGQFHDVPFITGVTSSEGMIVMKFGTVDVSGDMEKFSNNMEQIVLPDLRLPENYTKGGEVIAKIKKFYFNDQPIGEDKQGFLDLYSDILFVEGIHVGLKQIERHGKSPIYLYKFAADTKLSTFKHIMIESKLPGSCHGDDLGYLFQMAMVNFNVEPGSIEDLSRSRMVQMWVNFAKTGNPTSQVNNLVPITWPTYSAANPSYLDIGEHLVIDRDIFKTRMGFWEELYRSA